MCILVSALPLANGLYPVEIKTADGKIKFCGTAPQCAAAACEARRRMRTRTRGDMDAWSRTESVSSRVPDSD